MTLQVRNTHHIAQLSLNQALSFGVLFIPESKPLGKLTGAGSSSRIPG